MCSASADGKRTARGKVPARKEYVVADELDLTSNAASRRLARIITHGPDACIDSGKASGYLNRPDVQAAIHVRDPGFCWAVCNTAPGWKYTVRRCGSSPTVRACV